MRVKRVAGLKDARHDQDIALVSVRVGISHEGACPRVLLRRPGNVLDARGGLRRRSGAQRSSLGIIPVARAKCSERRTGQEPVQRRRVRGACRKNDHWEGRASECRVVIGNVRSHCRLLQRRLALEQLGGVQDHGARVLPAENDG